MFNIPLKANISFDCFFLVESLFSIFSNLSYCKCVTSTCSELKILMMHLRLLLQVLKKLAVIVLRRRTLMKIFFHWVQVRTSVTVVMIS